MLRLSLSDYEQITPAQFFNMSEGFFGHLNRMQEAEWLRTNYLVYAVMVQNPYIDKRSKPKSFDEFLKIQEKANAEAQRIIEQL